MNKNIFKLSYKDSNDCFLLIKKDPTIKKYKNYNGWSENSILELIYEIPALDGLKKCLITEDVIKKGQSPLLTFDNEAKTASN